MITLAIAYPFLIANPNVTPEVATIMTTPLQDVVTRQDWPQRSAEIVLAVEHDDVRPLFELMPFLRDIARERFPKEELSARAVNSASRNDIHIWSDLGALSPRNLSDWRNVGRRTLSDIFRLCVTASASSITAERSNSSPFAHTGQSKPSQDILDESPTERALAGSTHRPLEVVRQWAVNEAPHLSVLSDFLQINPDLELPGRVRSALGSMINIDLDLPVTPIEVFEPAPRVQTFPEALERFLGEFSSIELNIIVARIWRTHPATLAQLGEDFGVTRERVRQIQVGLEARLDEMTCAPEYEPLRERAAPLTLAIGSFAPASDASVVRAMAEYTRDVPDELEEMATCTGLWFAGRYQFIDEWLCAGGRPLPDASVLHHRFDKFGSMRLVLAKETLASEGINDIHFAAWVESIGDHRIYNENLLRWGNSAIDKVIALLRALGEPTADTTLIEMVDEGHNVRAIRDRLFQDDRVIRSSRTEWALRDWGYPEYTNVAGLIARQIAENGGAIQFADLASHLAGTFGIAEDTTRAQVRTPLFSLVGNQVRLRGIDEPRPRTELLAKTPNVFNHSDRVSWLHRIDGETLRGSSRPIPNIVATMLGIGPGEEQTYRSATGSLALSWPDTSITGARCGSIRSLAFLTGMGDGDYLRLDFIRSTQAVDVTPFTASKFATSRLGVLQDATGLQLSPNMVSALSAATDLPADDLAYALEERGDDQVGKLVRSLRLT